MEGKALWTKQREHTGAGAQHMPALLLSIGRGDQSPPSRAVVGESSEMEWTPFLGAVTMIRNPPTGATGSHRGILSRNELRFT